MAYLLQFDGAAEPNPGPASSALGMQGHAGGAYVIFSPLIEEPSGDTIRGVIQEGYTFLEHATNNEAEYTGLILGLTKALELGIEHIEIEGDSSLVINQVQGKWKVKADHLVPYQSKANKLLWKFKTWKVRHVYREQNTDADRLSKEALETRKEEHREGF